MPTLSLYDVSLFYVDRGRGVPLLLVHGFPLDHSMWDAQIETLVPHFRVIAPDLRGFGQSGVTLGKVTMAQFADDLAALLDHVVPGEPVVLCGLSMGGYIALAFWRQYAMRLRGLVLCDTRAAADTSEGIVARHQMAARVLAEGPAPVADAMLPRMFSPDTLSWRPEVVERWRSMVLRTAPEAIAAAALGMAERPDATGWLADIGCPTLVVGGAADVTSPPAEMREMAGRIPGARCVEIHSAGHLSPMENPSAVNTALEAFLREF